MGSIVVKKDNGWQCFARLKLDSGEQIMISVAQSGVKIFKMKWAGLFPAATLWESKTIVEVAEKFFDSEKPLQRPLDSMIDKLIDSRSAAEVVVRLTR
jgi:hypothetical protein